MQENGNYFSRRIKHRITRFGNRIADKITRFKNRVSRFIFGRSREEGVLVVRRCSFSDVNNINETNLAEQDFEEINVDITRIHAPAKKIRSLIRLSSLSNNLDSRNNEV